jgi:hypothetical protein
MARYWADHVEAMMNFRADHPDIAYSIRYEDLVASPSQVLEALFVFLGTSDAAVPPTDRIFHESRRLRGPQDHKISFTSDFLSASVGRGWGVPTEMIPQQLVERVNHLSEQLGYLELDGGLEDAVLGSGSAVPLGQDSRSRAGEERRALIHDCLSEFFESSTHYAGLAAMKLLVPDVNDSWIIDFPERTVRQAEGVCGSTVIVDGATFAAIVSGAANPAAEVRRGAMRAVGPAGPNAVVEVQRHLDAFLAELKAVLELRRNRANSDYLVEV